MKKFEDILSKISNPEINNLKHEDLLAKAISQAKQKSALSFWWIIIPLYVIAAFVMKSIFMPKNSFLSNMHGLIDKNGYTAVLIFIVVPAALIITNLWSIKIIYYLSGRSAIKEILCTAGINILITLISIFLIIIYFI